MDQLLDYQEIQEAYSKLDERNTKEEQEIEAAAFKARTKLQQGHEARIHSIDTTHEAAYTAARNEEHTKSQVLLSAHVKEAYELRQRYEAELAALKKQHEAQGVARTNECKARENRMLSEWKEAKAMLEREFEARMTEIELEVERNRAVWMAEREEEMVLIGEAAVRISQEEIQAEVDSKAQVEAEAAQTRARVQIRAQGIDLRLPMSPPTPQAIGFKVSYIRAQFPSGASSEYFSNHSNEPLFYRLHDEAAHPRPAYAFRPYMCSSGFDVGRQAGEWTLNPRGITSLLYNPALSLLWARRAGNRGEIYVQFVGNEVLERFLRCWVEKWPNNGVERGDRLTLPKRNGGGRGLNGAGEGG